MAGDLTYSWARFGHAVALLALGDGTYRDRLQRALTEALHDISADSPRPIPPELHDRISTFFASIRRVDELSDKEAWTLGIELLVLASELDIEADLQQIERSTERFRFN